MKDRYNMIISTGSVCLKQNKQKKNSDERDQRLELMERKNVLMD